jgi:hypothetical protein
MLKPKTHLLELVVTVKGPGSFETNVYNYYNGVKQDTPLSVIVGDRVGWFVQVNIPGSRTTLPYTVSFDDPSFFGVSSLSSVTGGTSDFLIVRAVEGVVQYHVSVTGLGCVLDPEIQSGSDGIKISQVNNFVVQWDVQSQTITWSSGGSDNPFPMQVHTGDKVTFEAINTTGTITDFNISFSQNNNQWATPFCQSQYTLPAGASNPTYIGPLPVKDPGDSGNSFPFTASLKQDGVPVQFPTTVAITM